MAGGRINFSVYFDDGDVLQYIDATSYDFKGAWFEVSYEDRAGKVVTEYIPAHRIRNIVKSYSGVV